MTPYQADGMMLLINEPQGCKALADHRLVVGLAIGLSD